MALMAESHGVRLASYVNVDLILPNCRIAQRRGLLAVVGTYDAIGEGAADTVIASGILNFGCSDWLALVDEVTRGLLRIARRQVVLTIRPPVAISLDELRAHLEVIGLVVDERRDYRPGEGLWVLRNAVQPRRQQWPLA